jgi:hypothetical protein
MSFLNRGFDKVTRGFAQTFFPSKDATYIVRIDSVTNFEVRKKEVVKVALTILEVRAETNVVGVKSLVAGNDACVWWDDGNADAGPEMLAKNVKTFLCEITGRADAEIGRDEAAAALTEGGELEGLVVQLDTILRAKKKSEGNFLAYKFSTPFSQEEIDALPESARKLLV